MEEDDDNPCSGTNEDLGTIVQQPIKDVVNGDDEDEDHDEEDDDSDCDEDVSVTISVTYDQGVTFSIT